MREAAPTLRVRWPTLLLWATLLLLANELEHVPQYILLAPAMARKWDLADPTPHGTFVRLAGEAAMLLLGVAFMALASRLQPALLQRPARFMAWILASATAGFAVVRVAAVALTVPQWNPRLQIVARDWTALMVWCTLFGWLLFLTLRRHEDRARLALMLMRRVALMRQLAQSRLGAARAQIEPEMIAGVLRTVKARAAAPDAFAVGTALDPVLLIDHLATYLRQLLDRLRHGTPTLAADLALVRSLVALREAETGIALDLRIDASLAPQAPRSAMATFLVARAMLDAAVQCAPTRVRLALAAREAGLAVQVWFAGAAMADPVRARLAATLAGLQPAAGADRHRFESGMHCHEVDVPLA